jgi:hypothetical protein
MIAIDLVLLEGFEGFSTHDERKERKSDFENSEDERRTTNKAMNPTNQ